tara:strand:+ start:2052 stop:2891 length:840 start_codon:yes stop_codon:yes gene_type:complete
MYMRLKKLILRNCHRKTLSKVNQHMFNRADKIRALIDPASQRGLEIGALNSPAIYPSEGEVYYVDHLPTDELKEKYSPDPNVNIEDIVPVDYVWGDRTLVEAVGQGVYFDYLVASHVVEHVPDMIGWFGEISAILKPGGVLSLVIPDKRFTFDCQRNVSRASEFIEAFLLKSRKPSLRQVFDSHYCSAPVEAGFAWSEGFQPANLNNVHSHPQGVFDLCRKILDEDLYLDSHCYTFTPESFDESFNCILQLKLTDFELMHLFPTDVNGMEFYVSLRKPL